MNMVKYRHRGSDYRHFIAMVSEGNRHVRNYRHDRQFIAMVRSRNRAVA
jgi:hypothetical protein